MDTAVAIVSFGSGGMIEVRAEPAQEMLLEVRSQTGTARTATHEWHPGRGGVRLIRYQRGEAVEQRPVLPGQVQRVVTGRVGESLRLQGVSDDGTPRVLDFRVVSASTLTGAHSAVAMAGVSPAASLELAAVPTRHPTGAVPAVAPPAADLTAVVTALDARLQPQLGALAQRMEALEGRIASQANPDAHLSRQIEALAAAVSAAPAGAPAPTVDLTPVLARLDALTRATSLSSKPNTAPFDLGPLLDRLDALDVRVASAGLGDAPDLGSLVPRLDALEDRLAGLAHAVADPAAPEARLASLETRLNASLEAFRPDLTPVAAALSRLQGGLGDLQPDLSPLTVRLSAIEAALTARFSAVESALAGDALVARFAAALPTPPAPDAEAARVGTALESALAAALPALGQSVDKGLESRLIPLFAALDRADRERALAQERDHAITDRLVSLETRLDDDGGLGGRLAATHERITRLATQVGEALAGGERLDAVAEHLTRIERLLLAAPSLDGRLTAIQAQIGRIEEGAGSITPELIELIATKLETLDPRAGMADLDARVFGFSRRLDEITALLNTGLGANSPLGGVLTGTLGRLETEQARLAEGLSALAPALAEGLTPLAAEAAARTLAQQAMAETLAGAVGELRALNERGDPAPALAEVRSRLDALADTEHTAQSLDRLRAGLDALVARPAPAPPPDHTDALLRIDEQVGRLERHIRSDGKQVDKAIAAAMAAVRSFSDDGQLELIEERLSLMEKRTGGIDPRVVEQLESAARKLRDAGPGADLTPVLDRLDELGRRVTQMPPVQPPVVEFGDLESKVDALGAQLAALGGTAFGGGSRDAGPSPELVALGAQLERLEQRLDALAASREARAPDFDMQSIEVRLDALADLLAGPARRGGERPDLDDSLALSSLEAQLEALDAGHLPGEVAGAGAAGALSAQLTALTTRLDGLSDRLGAAPSAEQAVTPVLAALEGKLDALADRIDGLGAGGGPAAANHHEAGLGALATRLDVITTRLDALARTGAEHAELASLAQKVEGLGRRLETGGNDGMGVLAVKIDALTARVEDSAMARLDDQEMAPLLHLVERLGSRVDALADRVDVLAGRLSTPPGHGMPLAGPEVEVPLDAAEESIDISSFPPGGDDAGPSVPPPAVAPPRPEPPRRSSDGAMLDGIDQLIDVIQTRHADQQSVRGLLSQPRLDALRGRLGAVRAAFAGRLPGSTARLIDQLVERIDDARTDALHAAQTALASGDFAQAIQKVARVLQAESQAPLNTENVERTVLGIAKAVWDADSALAATEGPGRQAMEDLLAELELVLILPTVNTSWQPKDQRVQGRRPGRPGEPLNLVLEVHAPGFRRGDTVVDKAAVTISD